MKKKVNSFYVSKSWKKNSLPAKSITRETNVPLSSLIETKKAIDIKRISC